MLRQHTNRPGTPGSSQSQRFVDHCHLPRHTRAANRDTIPKRFHACQTTHIRLVIYHHTALFVVLTMAKNFRITTTIKCSRARSASIFPFRFGR